MKLLKVLFSLFKFSILFALTMVMTVYITEFGLRTFPPEILSHRLDERFTDLYFRPPSEMDKISPGRRIAPMIKDPILSHKPNPEYEDHDENGWRNEKLLKKADIVVLGDSQSYGVNAKREEAWPQQLGQKANQSVYQMAYGAYGPAHYLVMLDEALKLQPKKVLIGIYLGNDVLDTYMYVYNSKPEFQRKPFVAIDNLVSKDKKTLALLEKAEKIDPVFMRHSNLSCERHIKDINPILQTVENILEAPPLRSVNRSLSKQKTEFQVWLNRKISVKAEKWYLLEAIIKAVNRQAVLADQKKRQSQTEFKATWPAPICHEIRIGELETILTPAYRLVSLESTDPRVVEGERLTFKIIELISGKLKKENVDHSFVIIPTKERVFESTVKNKLPRDDKSKYLYSLWSQEKKYTQRLTDFLKKKNIHHIDVSSPLIKSLESGKNPYSNNTDGHPRNFGYGIIADTIYNEVLKR